MLGTSELRRAGGVRGNRPTVVTVGGVEERTVWGWVMPDRTGTRCYLSGSHVIVLVGFNILSSPRCA